MAKSSHLIWFVALLSTINHGTAYRFDEKLYFSMTQQNQAFPSLLHGVSQASTSTPVVMDGIVEEYRIALETNSKLKDEFEDIDVRKNNHTNSRRKRRAAYYDKWKRSQDGMVYIPYRLDISVHDQTRYAFERAIEDYHRETCIRFVPRTTESAYVFVVKDKWIPGCWVQEIGYRGEKPHLLSLNGERCRTKGTAIHELMHILGFYHEHQRRDRDEHIDIIIENVYNNDDLRSQFDSHKYAEGFVYGEPYDLKSVMHYGRYSASIKPKHLATIIPKPDPSVEIGQRDGFSAIDIIQLNKRYMCTDFLTTVRPPVNQMQQYHDTIETGRPLREQCAHLCELFPTIELIQLMCCT